MSGRETCGLEENATATSATPSSSAEMPASATVERHERGRHVESVCGLQPHSRSGVDQAVGGRGEPHLLRLRGRGKQPNHESETPSAGHRMGRPYRLTGRTSKAVGWSWSRR